jgi:hypothetical protein
MHTAAYLKDWGWISCVRTWAPVCRRLGWSVHVLMCGLERIGACTWGLYESVMMMKRPFCYFSMVKVRIIHIWAIFDLRVLFSHWDELCTCHGLYACVLCTCVTLGVYACLMYLMCVCLPACIYVLMCVWWALPFKVREGLLLKVFVFFFVCFILPFHCISLIIVIYLFLFFSSFCFSFNSFSSLLSSF